MSIRILIDHGVKEEHIIFVTFLVARSGGVSVLQRAFPNVRIVCGAVDDEMREGWLEGYRGEGNPEGRGRKCWVMQPGIGQIGKLGYKSRGSILNCRTLQGIVTIFDTEGSHVFVLSWHLRD